MRLSWAEIRTRAAKFANDWKHASYEKGETQSFYNDFFEIFGVRRRSVARYEQRVKSLGNKSGFIDLFWPGVLVVEQKSAGRSLAVAREQALAYCEGLSEGEQPRYLMLSDFQSIELIDLDERTESIFSLEDLPAHVEKFAFILGVQVRKFRDQDPVNVKASEIMGHIYDSLRMSGYTSSGLDVFLVRLMFCLFSDDTGIFEPRDIFHDLIEHKTKEDGSDLGMTLSHLFQVIKTPYKHRQKSLDEELARFPYVNGSLFRDSIDIPSFDSRMRKELIDACRFDWSRISPAIFGALFQSVMDMDERRKQGAHYTSEKNILKVIEPLFLDNLNAELDRTLLNKSNRRIRLQNFQRKLANMNFLDPACGCGNFLVITYRELRELEHKVLKELYPVSNDGRQQHIYPDSLSLVNVDQFHGMEMGKYPARIAETAMWMMDHIMNNKLSLMFGQVYARIPLVTSPNIHCCDALETDWAEILAPGKCSYLIGNPPFVGSKLQDGKQREQIQKIAGNGRGRGTLDYVAAWFILAARYAQEGDARMAFVSTNSITQGEQVAQLWPMLLDELGLEISFAHQSFVWNSDARGQAKVDVIIIGMDKSDSVPRKKRLYTYEGQHSNPLLSEPNWITPYLQDGSSLSNPHLVVRSVKEPINGMPRLLSGCQPIDDGNYILDARERNELIGSCPEAGRHIHPFVGAKEFTSDNQRWILLLHDADHTVMRKESIQKRVAAVREFRGKSKRSSTRELAKTPALFQVNVIPSRPFLAMQETGSSLREYIPIAWLRPPTIPSNSIRILTEATKPMFALLTSSMHMVWLRHVGGKLASSFRYSISIVYNNFPVPQVHKRRLEKLTVHADAVIRAREKHPQATLADLYSKNMMPPELLKAHRALDNAVERLYRAKSFTSDAQRIKHLFMMYEQMVAPVTRKSHGIARKTGKVTDPIRIETEETIEITINYCSVNLSDARISFASLDDHSSPVSAIQWSFHTINSDQE